MPGGSDLVVVGDVHLDRDDPDLRPFLADLRRLGATAGRVVLMGDLFNLWIGAPDLEQDHHRAVLGALREIRRSGVEVHYLEGNRDYRIAKAHLGDAFDSATDGGLDESWGGRRLFAAHGDLVNVRDRQYRAWRRASRSNAAWWLLSAIPRAQRFAVAERLERSMRATNLDQKAAFPDAEARAYAAPYFEKGYDAVLLGHFHVEKELVAVPPARPGRVYVLPEWKGTRRHLRVTAAGEIRFEGV